MPAVAEPPKPAKPDAFQQSAMAGKSPADLYQAPEPSAPSTLNHPPEGFGDGLEAAQRQDKGAAPAQAPASPAAAPATPPAQPAGKVPGLPTDEWRPKGEKAGAQWDALKTKHSEELTTVRAEMDRVKAELSAAKLVGSPDVDGLKKELAEYKSLLKDVAIERDPEFKQAYSTREKAAVDAATMAAGDKADQLTKLLGHPSSPWRDEQINKLVDGLSASAQRRVNASLQVMEQIDVERSAEIARRRATFERKQAITTAQQREQEATMQRAMEAEFNSVFKQWTDPTQGHPFFTEIEGDKDHNARVGEARQLAKAVFSGQLSPKELATAAHWAATGPLALEGWKSAIKRAEAAESALDKIRGVNPGDGRTGSPEGEGSREAPKPGTPEYMKYMNAGLKQAQAKDFSARRGVK